MTAADLSADLPAHAVDAATRHLHAVLTIALEHGPAQKTLVVYDTRTGLSRQGNPLHVVVGRQYVPSGRGQGYFHG